MKLKNILRKIRKEIHDNNNIAYLAKCHVDTVDARILNIAAGLQEMDTKLNVLLEQHVVDNDYLVVKFIDVSPAAKACAGDHSVYAVVSVSKPAVDIYAPILMRLGDCSNLKMSRNDCIKSICFNIVRDYKEGAKMDVVYDDIADAVNAYKKIQDGTATDPDKLVSCICYSSRISKKMQDQKMEELKSQMATSNPDPAVDEKGDEKKEFEKFLEASTNAATTEYTIVRIQLTNDTLLKDGFNRFDKSVYMLVNIVRLAEYRAVPSILKFHCELDAETYEKCAKRIRNDICQLYRDGEIHAKYNNMDVALDAFNKLDDGSITGDEADKMVELTYVVNMDHVDESLAE